MSREVATVRSPPLDLERLRVSALTRAAALSPRVREATIGPNSPQTKRDTYADTLSLVPPKDESATEIRVKDRVSREDRIFLEAVRQYEAQLMESSESNFKEIMERMMAQYKESTERFRRKQAEEMERTELALRNRVLQMLKAWDLNDKEMVLERITCKRDKQDNHTTRTVANMKIIEEQNEAAGRLSAIADSHAIIVTLREEIDEIFQTDDNLVRMIQEKYLTGLNSVITNMNNILDLGASGAITDKEVKLAQVLALNIVNLKKKALDEIADLKEKEQKHRKERELKLQKENEEREREKKEKELKIAESTKSASSNGIQTPVSTTPEKVIENTEITKPVSTKAKPLFYSNKNFEYHLQLKSFLENYESSYKTLASDPRCKDFCFDCRKAVNVPVNALCSVSGHHIRDKYEKLSKLLRGEKVQVMNSYVCATQHPQGLAYCTALLAKKLVNQGGLIVSSQPEAAFPLASVIIALWSQFPELGKLIEAYFQRECPYLVPMFLPQTEGMSDQEFYKSRGYLYDDEGDVEKQDMFLKRMSGCFRLMCAIWIATPPRAMKGQNPHGLMQAWKWIASFVNLKPESQISATLLYDFIAVCGNACLKTYGKQFTKVIKLICTHYLPDLDKIDEGGPKMRLEVFLQKVLQSGAIPPPSGQLPPNVW